MSEPLTAVPWRWYDDGEPCQPSMQADGSILWYRGVYEPGHDAPSSFEVEPEPPDRIGLPEGDRLVLRVTYFGPGGTCPDPTGESGSCTSVPLGVPMTTLDGQPLSDEQLEEAVRRVVRSYAATVRAEVQELIRKQQDRLGRAELVRRGLIASENDRPNRDRHDQRRRVLARIGDCIHCSEEP